MKKQTLIIVLVITLIILGGVWYFYNQNTRIVTNANTNANQVPEGIDTNEWVEYTNLTLGYKVKFPSNFKSYAETTGLEVPLTNDAQSIYMRDSSKPLGVMIGLSSTAGKTIDEAFDYQEERFDTDTILINDILFVRDPAGGNYVISGNRYLVKTNTHLIVIQFEANSEEDYEYLRDGVLSSFTIK